uniref:Suppressor of white apricot N-terminal domain-containing protein n=1 Tax=Pectinophora gossypiella TaxID=13191 RepID=A0A1E1WQ85_PECGO
MWHEARKQERMIRGMIVDYRRRAERRKDFYEKIKAEPTQFLQLHGRPCKIHLDPTVAAAGEGPAIMMPWQGDTNNMIDRFDVRAHLDYIPDVRNPDVPPDKLSPEERQCNYERYRIIAQNAFLGISEDKFLQQLAIEEQFGVTIEEKEMQKERLHEKKGTGAAIGYNYNDPGAQPSCSNGSSALLTLL